MTREELKQKAQSLPLSPGVYIMMNEAGEVIYVGKSRALKNRVSQYFANLASHTGKTRTMVSQIDHFDYILADNEFEALVLECSLIKRHKPRYNILLKSAFFPGQPNCGGWSPLLWPLRQPEQQPGDYPHSVQRPAPANVPTEISKRHWERTALPQSPHWQLRRLVPGGDDGGRVPRSNGTRDPFAGRQVL